MTIRYNHATAPIRLEWPTDWPSIVTGVTLAIYGTDGTALRAASATVVPAATAMTVAAVSGDTAITVAAIGTWAVGDVIRLQRVGGASEDVPIQQIAGLVITLGRAMVNDYPVGSTVLPRHCTTTQDTTDTDTWTIGLQVELVWQPDTATPAHTELVEVRSQEFSIAGLRETFAALYPDEYRAIENRWTKIEEQAELRIKGRMLAWPQKYIDTLVDQRALEPITLDEIRLLALRSGGSVWSDEMTDARKVIDEQWKTFNDQATWFDTNEDHTEDKEIEVHSGDWRPSGRVW